MQVKTRVESSQFGKVHILECDIGGLRFEARHVWPPEYDLLDKADAMTIIEHYLWRNLMNAIENELRKTAARGT